MRRLRIGLLRESNLKWNPANKRGVCLTIEDLEKLRSWYKEPDIMVTLSYNGNLQTGKLYDIMKFIRENIKDLQKYVMVLERLDTREKVTI